MTKAKGDLTPTRGRRLRIRLDAYNASTRQFSPISGFAARFNVMNAAQRDVVWKAITTAIEKALENAGVQEEHDDVATAAGPADPVAGQS